MNSYQGPLYASWRQILCLKILAFDFCPIISAQPLSVRPPSEPPTFSFSLNMPCSATHMLSLLTQHSEANSSLSRWIIYCGCNQAVLCYQCPNFVICWIASTYSVPNSIPPSHLFSDFSQGLSCFFAGWESKKWSNECQFSVPIKQLCAHPGHNSDVIEQGGDVAYFWLIV